MKTVKTSDLTGLALDWAVAKCLGVTVRIDHGYEPAICLCSTQDATHFGGTWVFIPSRDWRQGGPIIEREWLDVTPWPNESREGMRWHCQQHDSGGDCAQYGPTPLIAAMRCYVASQLGEKIEIPEELLT